VLKKNSVYITR